MEKVINSTKPDIDKLPGGWAPNLQEVIILEGNEPRNIKVIDLIPGAFVLENALSPLACKKLIALMQRSPNFESVSIQGRKDVVDDREGSKRTTMWSPELAKTIWGIIASKFQTKFCDENTLTDWWQGNKQRKIWKPVAMSPMLRFMKYQKGGEHYAHYDAGFIYPDDNYRSLQSVVIYLTTNMSGNTRFIDDKQTGPVWNRTHDDFIKRVEPGTIQAASLPIQGNILIFDHRMCHDVELYKGEEEARIIIRGDIVYQGKTEEDILY